MSRQVFLMLLSIPAVANGQVAPAPDRTTQMLETARQLVAVDADGCLLRPDDAEIVVCGIPEIDRQRRLPFPELEARSGESIREPLPTGNPEIVQQGRCYVTMDERNCFRGLTLVSVGLGGSGSGVSGAVGRVWRAIEPGVPDENYVRQAMIKPLSPAE